MNESKDINEVIKRAERAVEKAREINKGKGSISTGNMTQNQVDVILAKAKELNKRHKERFH